MEAIAFGCSQRPGRRLRAYGRSASWVESNEGVDVHVIDRSTGRLLGPTEVKTSRQRKKRSVRVHPLRMWMSSSPWVSSVFRALGYGVIAIAFVWPLASFSSGVIRSAECRFGSHAWRHSRTPGQGERFPTCCLVSVF